MCLSAFISFKCRFFLNLHGIWLAMVWIQLEIAISIEIWISSGWVLAFAFRCVPISSVNCRFRAFYCCALITWTFYMLIQLAEWPELSTPCNYSIKQFNHIHCVVYADVTLPHISKCFVWKKSRIFAVFEVFHLNLHCESTKTTENMLDSKNTANDL